MKRTFTVMALIGAGFCLGWFAHLAFTHDPQRGLQWQFVDAAGRGDLTQMEALLRRGAQIDAVPSYANGAVSGAPALWVAARAGQPESVAWLLARGANPNIEMSDSDPLSAARHRIEQATKAADILRAHGAKSRLY